MIRVNQRSAFTLLELLVVILVASILAALLMPAVHSVRTTARRLHCSSNLRQLGLAVTAYETLHRSYPPSSVTRPRQHGLLTFLLPFADQQTVYDRYDWQQSWDAGGNRAATRVNIGAFRCPSTPHRSDYAADFASCRNLVSPARRVLVLTGRVRDRHSWISILQQSRSTPAMVADGLTNSLMLFEDAGRPRKYVQRTRRAGSVSGAAWADDAAAFEIHSVCRSGAVINCRNDNEIYSFHKQGCNFLYGDGSVQFLREDIDPEIFVSLFTRAAGDVVGLHQ